MLGVRQWRHVELRHGAFCVSGQHRLCRWWPAHYSWKAHVVIHLRSKVYNRWIASNFPFKWHRTTRTTSCWKSSIFNRNSSGERRLKFIASGEDHDNKKPRAKHKEHHLGKRRQRRQHSDHKHGQRQRQNTTITLQMEPMKRENTDCRRFKKRWGDQATLAVYSKITCFEATIAATVTRSVQFTSRISFQRTEDGGITPWAILGFTVSLQWTVYNPRWCVTCREALHLWTKSLLNKIFVYNFYYIYFSKTIPRKIIYLCVAALHVSTAVSFKSNITKIYYCWPPILDPI